MIVEHTAPTHVTASTDDENVTQNTSVQISEAVEVSFEDNSSEELKFSSVDISAESPDDVNTLSDLLIHNEDIHSDEEPSSSKHIVDEIQYLSEDDHSLSSPDIEAQSDNTNIEADSEFPNVDIDLTQERSVTLGTPLKPSFSSTAFVSTQIKPEKDERQTHNKTNSEIPKAKPVEEDSDSRSLGSEAVVQNPSPKIEANRRPPPFSKSLKTPSATFPEDPNPLEPQTNFNEEINDPSSEQTNTLTLDMNLPQGNEIPDLAPPGSDLIASVHEKSEDSKRWTPNVFLSINLVLFIVILALIVVS